MTQETIQSNSNKTEQEDKSVKISIPGTPVAKARARITRSGHSFTPQKTKDAELIIQDQARLKLIGKELPIFPKETALALEINFLMPIPGSWSKKKKQLALEGLLAHTSRPDVDNLIKLVKDALNGITYHDDSQVTVLMASKSYAPEPGTNIKIFPV